MKTSNEQSSLVVASSLLQNNVEERDDCQERQRPKRTKLFHLDKYSGEPVVTEPGLEDCEQEAAFYLSGRTSKDGYVQASSNLAPIVRGLLAHPDFTVEEIMAIGTRLDPRIVYVAGRLPANCLRVTSAKGSTSIGKIVTPSARRPRSSVPSESSDEAPARAPVQESVAVAL